MSFPVEWDIITINEYVVSCFISLPKDLLRSVGKIEREDWNVKEIERKILENRLGRPEPKNAEKVPKWDREQFLGRQRRLKEGDNQEKWGQIDETLHKLDQKLRDSGRPDHGTKKVANLANKFVKQVEEPAKEKKEKEKEKEREETKKTWHGNAASGPACAACGARVFAAEGVTADGRRLHRACFRCALCAAALRPGNYTMERNGTRLVCLRHSGANIPDSGPPKTGAAAMTPERISLEASDHCAREIDEDEWTVSNFLASETSGAGGLSDEDESSSDEYTDVEESSAEAEAEAEAGPGAPRLSPVYLSDDSFGYDDYSDDGGSSSGAESCSRLRDALEARRREVPAEPRAPTDSSEVESDDDSSSSSSEEDVSSGTGVSTDSEFACEEPADSTPAPAITVTEAPPVPAPGHATPPIPAPATPPPLCRARSAGGLATKRALELKRKYLLGEASPPVVRRSDSTSQLDTKLETFRSNISEFQKMLNPAPPAPQPRPVIAFTLADRPPMPDIISNLCEDAPVDLLTKISDVNHEQEPQETEDEDAQSSSAVKGGDSDSSSDSPAPPSVPRLEVHDEGGDLIQLDSLVILSQAPEQPVVAEPQPESPVNAAPESEWSESCRDVSTLALTETDLSDWAAESAMLEDCATYDGKKAKSRSAPKTVHDAKNISAITSHVCGRTSPPKQLVDYANALEHFQFADEEDQDPSIATPPTPKNEGYMELVDDDEHPYSPVNDRSMNFIERSFSETIIAPHADTARFRPHDEMANSTDSESTITRLERPTELKSPQLLVTIESSGSEKSIDNSTVNNVNENNSTSKIEDAKEVVSQASSSSKEAQAPSASELKSEQASEPVAEVTVAQPARSTSDHSERSEQSPPADRSARSSEQCSRSTSDEFVRSTSEPHTRSPLKHTCKLSQSSSASPPLAATPDKSPLPMPIVFSTLKLYTPICRSASETFSRSPSHSLELSVSLNLSSGSVSPECARATTHKVQEIKREREEQTEVVRLLVLERLGGRGRRGGRPARQRAPPLPPPPVPPPPALPPPPLPVTPSFSDPELARETRKKNIIRSLSNYLNRRLGPRTKWVSEPDLSQNQEPRPASSRPPTAHKSCGGLEQAPPVPPPPASYYPPEPLREPPPRPSDAVERDAMQLWFEARWARLMSQRQDDRRLARLERRLRRPLSAEQQAAAVAELVQVSAQREAHEALMSADRRRCMTSGSACE
ncbi:hypothetical protein JYU34_000738 [Plutella xylostella]|uniref:LIM zinc-binding domain-containing protein n=1 Tax=Plutella xylostella TaxID=51655 RepID=A0ABQ7R8F0_PLUXY|nr:hypothetical protein JYU34_000738 [Plutella xylostella]